MSSSSGALPVFLSQRAFAASMHTVCDTACTADSIQAVIDGATPGDTISFAGDATLGHELAVNKSLTIEGNGHALLPNFAKTDSSNNAALGILANNVTVNNLVEDGTNGTGLHGVNVFEATDVNLSNVTLKNNDRNGLVVNGSTVVVNNITTSGNGWGGIDVDQGSGVITPAALTVTGTSTQSESLPIFVDDTTKGVTVNDVEDQYSYQASIGNSRRYFINHKPTIAFTSPANGAAFTSTPSFELTANDDLSIKNVTSTLYDSSNNVVGWKVLGGNLSTLTYSTSGPQTYDTNGTLPDGEYHMVAAVEDTYGKFAVQDTRTVYIDRTKPTAAFTSATTDPAPNGAYNGDFTVGYNVHDNVQLQTVNVALYDTVSSHTNHWVANCYANGNVGSNDVTGLCTVHIPASTPDGNYYVQIGGRDTAGNWTVNAVRYITVDRTIPTFALTDDGSTRKPIMDGAVINPALLGDHDHDGNTIRFTKESATDTLYVNGQPIFGHGYFNKGTSGLIGAAFVNEGAYTLYTRDSAGNQSASLTFTVDKTAPTVKVNLNRSGYANSGDIVRSAQKPEIEAFDKHLTKIEVWRKNGSKVTEWTNVAQNVTTFKGIGWLSDGTYIIRAYDAAGSASSDFEITIDNTAPTTPSITTPSDGQYFNSTPILNKWTAATDTNGIAKYQVAYRYADGHTFSGSTCAGVQIGGLSVSCRDASGLQRNHIPASTEQGGVTIWVRAQDNAGNWSSWSTPVQYTYDATAPTGTFTYSNNNGSQVTSSDVTATLTTNEEVRDIAGWTRVAGNQFTKVFTNNTKFTVVVTDLAGNSTTLKGEVKRIDRTAPTFNVHDGQTFTTLPVDIVATDQSLTDKLSVNGNPVQLVNDPKTWDWRTALSSDGAYTLIATDKAGNNTTVHITIDSTAPVVTITGYGQTGNKIQPNVTATDANSPLTYSWTTNANVDISNVNALNPVFTVNADGTYTFELTVTDPAGNSTTVPFTFTYTAAVGGFGGVGTVATNNTPAPLNDDNTGTGGQAVLGASTDSGNKDKGSDGNVKAATVTNAAKDAKSSQFLGLGWWWLAILALAAILWIVFMRRRSEEK